ncbi:MAG: glycine--tRNA ligase [Candidatus Woesearchaeota archaeon]
MTISIDDMAAFCKKKGFVFSNSELYGGMAGFFDYGPIGVEMKNNIKREWWLTHVQKRDDIVGIDGSIITHPKVWVASGHVGSFQDIMLSCIKCSNKVRADLFIEEQLKVSADGWKIDQINEAVRENNLKCPNCKTPFKDASQFNLMFKTNVGPKQDESSIAYLRPETAQLMFVDFKLVVDTARLKLPFGIAQIGRAFRNEISPRNFLFRCREFEQMEIEYFIHPDAGKDCPFLKDVDYKLWVYSAEMQKNHEDPKLMSVKDALSKKIMKSPWHAFWLIHEHQWFVSLGVNPDNFRVRQHNREELAHYSTDCWDLEYKFPFGYKELEGIADRSDYDLQQHIKHSGKDLSLFDEKTAKKVVPHVVAEPSLGVDRTFLTLMFDAYTFDKSRDNVVLKLHPKVAPVKLAVFPLLSNKPELVEKAKKIHNDCKQAFPCFFDLSGSVGRRYARQDEQGTPWCATIDFQTLEDDTVTLRDRDTTKQVRLKSSELASVIARLLEGEIDFEKAGNKV